METLLASPGPSPHKRSRLSARPKAGPLQSRTGQTGRLPGPPQKRVSQGRKLGLEARAAQRWEEVWPPQGLWQAGPLSASPGTVDPRQEGDQVCPPPGAGDLGPIRGSLRKVAIKRALPGTQALESGRIYLNKHLELGGCFQTRRSGGSGPRKASRRPQGCKIPAVTALAQVPSPSPPWRLLLASRPWPHFLL